MSNVHAFCPEMQQVKEQSPTKDTCALILSGGHGERFGNPGGKQLYPLCGIPMFIWSVLAFAKLERVGCVVCVTPEEDEQLFRDVLQNYDLGVVVLFAPSGSSRHESACAGLAAAPQSYEYIAVHDGARPLILSSTIQKALEELTSNPQVAGVVCGHPAIDTLKITEGNRIQETPNRSQYWVAQTPQIFRRAALEEAYSEAAKQGLVGTDDASLLEQIGQTVLMVDSPRDNLKVTVPEDAHYVEAILEGRIITCSE